MKIGFTGTREGMTQEQMRRFDDIVFRIYLKEHAEREFHHGDCIGADEDAHGLISSYSAIMRHAHPCTLTDQRAFTENDVEYKALPPLERNRVIVDAVDVMIACPSGTTELFRGSGTWATIRYARDGGKPLFIIWPDGSFTREN